MTSLGIIPVTSPQPRGIIIPIVSENLPFKVKRKALAMPSGQKKGIGNAFGSNCQCLQVKMKALPMPSGQNEGTANFPYQILLVSFHLQYRNVVFLIS